MGLTFLVALLGIALLYVTLWKYEMAAKNARSQVRRLRRTLLGEDAVRPIGPQRGAVVSLLSPSPRRCRWASRASTSPRPTSCSSS